MPLSCQRPWFESRCRRGLWKFISRSPTLEAVHLLWLAWSCNWRCGLTDFGWDIKNHWKRPAPLAVTTVSGLYICMYTPYRVYMQGVVVWLLCITRLGNRNTEEWWWERSCSPSTALCSDGKICGDFTFWKPKCHPSVRQGKRGVWAFHWLLHITFTNNIDRGLNGWVWYWISICQNLRCPCQFLTRSSVYYFKIFSVHYSLLTMYSVHFAIIFHVSVRFALIEYVDFTTFH